MIPYESLVKKVGKQKKQKPFCMLASGPCPHYDGYVPAECRVNVRVICKTGAETGQQGDVSLRRARACLKKKLQEEKTALDKKKTPPGG